MSSEQPTEADYVEVKKSKKEMTPERLAQLQKAREIAAASRKDKAELKAKEKALEKLELETKKKEVDKRMMALNSPKSKAPKPPKKEKQVVYVDPSSSEEDEIEYVRRPKEHEERMSEAHIKDQIHRLRREHMMSMMFGGRAF